MMTQTIRISRDVAPEDPTRPWFARITNDPLAPFPSEVWDEPLESPADMHLIDVVGAYKLAKRLENCECTYRPAEGTATLRVHR